MDIPSKSALITGASGYIGSELANHLSQHGWEVNVIVRPNSDLSLLESLIPSSHFFTHLYDGNAESLLAAIRSSQPDVVFHLASSVLSDGDTKSIDLMMDANIKLGLHLAHAMSSSNVNNLINTGTFWQHYESEIYSPVDLYAATKQALEVLLQFYADARGLSVINLKLYDTYGDNDPRPKLLNRLKESLINGESLLMSSGEQKIDLVHIHDVVKAYRLAADRLMAGKVNGMESYGVSSSQPMKIKSLLELIEQVTGKVLPVQLGCFPYRDREVMDPVAMECLPGWVREVRLEKGIRRFFEALDREK